MKNVLFVGPYYQFDEWGKNARGMINMLADIDSINLTTRPIWLNNQMKIDIKHENQYEKFEENIFEEYDVIIQNVLPQYFIKTDKAKKNILYSSIDCFIDKSEWKSNINLADSIIVSSSFEEKAMSNIKTDNVKIHNIKSVIYDKTDSTKSIDISFNQTKFLCCSGSESKSGIYETIIGYLSAFNIYDNVVLIIATKDDKILTEQINLIKLKLGIYEDTRMYANIAIVSTDDEELIQFLQEYSDFYIDLSYNSRIGQNTLSATFNGSVPIVLDTIKNDLCPDYPLYVDSIKEISLYEQRAFSEMYRGEYYWYMPNTYSIREVLRKALDPSTLESAKNILSKYQQNYYTNIKNIIKEAIECS